MQNKSHSGRLTCAKAMALIATLTATLTACYDSNGKSDLLRSNIASNGVSMAVQANLSGSTGTVQLAAAVYKDGVRQPLVGGDIVQAQLGEQATLLRAIENLSGDYEGVFASAQPGDQVSFSVIHDPVAARADRWYPVDTLQVDPGASDLIGYEATITFPAPIRIDSPQPGQIYQSRGDEIVLTWVPDPTTDQVRVATTQTCYSGDQQLSWQDGYTFSNNTGMLSLGIDQLIPASGIIDAIGTVTNRLLSIIVSSLTAGLSLGLAEPVDLGTFTLEYCDIELTLLREITGTLGAGTSGGYAIGSSSDRVQVRFEP